MLSSPENWLRAVRAPTVEKPLIEPATFGFTQE
jgi:hypothetical protein